MLTSPSIENNYYISVLNVPSSHRIAAFPCVPGRHSHVIVLIGKVSRTLHFEFIPQGDDASHGLTHNLFIQPVCDGQSESL